MPAPAPLRLVALCTVALAGCTLPAAATARTTASPKLPKTFQKRYHVRSATADPDRDGLTNFTEYRGHTSPKRADSDHDGRKDGAEDWDRDGLDDATEQRAGTDPGRRDSDRDGRGDAREDADHDGLTNLAEQRTANDPGDPDSDDDGIRDGDEHAGRVVSFDGGELVLRLASTGRTVTGTIDDQSAVECIATSDYESAYDDDAAGDTAGAGDDTADDPSDDSAGDDGSGDDDSAVTADDDATASAAAFEDPGTTDDCFDQVLAPGAWVHEAELSDDGDGTLMFDAVALVDDER